jgi:hypothetical protein
MMTDELVAFLIKAKQQTYASGKSPDHSSRPNSHDLHFAEGDFAYIDTYLGGFHFIGEEAVWHNGKPAWGMNYYGKMLVDVIPAGFSEFLKAALLRVPAEAPFRGPAEYRDGAFSYHCRVDGGLERYVGDEEIWLNDKPIYWLAFHGGEIKD